VTHSIRTGGLVAKQPLANRYVMGSNSTRTCSLNIWAQVLLNVTALVNSFYVNQSVIQYIFVHSFSNFHTHYYHYRHRFWDTLNWLMCTNRVIGFETPLIDLCVQTVPIEQAALSHLYKYTQLWIHIFLFTRLLLSLLMSNKWTITKWAGDYIGNSSE